MQGYKPLEQDKSQALCKDDTTLAGTYKQRTKRGVWYQEEPKNNGRSTKRGAAEFLRTDISPEQKKEILKIRETYQQDLKRFAEECLRVIDRDSPTGAAIIPFRLNPCQLALHRYIEDIKAFNLERSTALNAKDPSVPISEYPINIVILKARKTGVSTYIQLRAFHRCEFQPHNNCLVMAHEQSASENIVKISKRFDEQFQFPHQLPIRKPLARVSDRLLEWQSDDNNLDSWDSRIVIKTGGTKVSGTSRSFTWHFVHISEEAHFPSSDEVSATLNACAKFSETYEESTAKGTGGLFYDTWQKSLRLEEARRLWRNSEAIPTWWNGKYQFFWSWLDDPGYRRHVEPWEEAQILSTLSAEEEELKREGASVEQLAFRRWKIASECSSQTEVDPIEYWNQEYPTKPSDAFISSGSNAFQTRALLEFKKQFQDKRPVFAGEVALDPELPADESVRFIPLAHRRNVVLWENPNPENEYIMGIDTAEGLKSSDNTVISLWNRLDGTRMHEAGRICGKYTPEETALIAVYLAKMYNEAFIFPEANFTGGAMCLKLVKLQYPYVYHRENPEEISDRRREIGFTVGFKTLANTKPLLISEGQGALRNGLIKIYDPRAIEEWLHYTNDDGIYTAPKGENDDHVMADLLAIYGNFSGKAPRVKRFAKVPKPVNVEKKKNMSREGEAMGKWLTKMRKPGRRNVRTRPVDLLR